MRLKLKMLNFWKTTSFTSRVHAILSGFLRREPRRRIQSPDDSESGERNRKLHRRRLRRRFDAKVSSGASCESKGRVISCRSACDVFDTDEYCCRGVYGNPSTCRPTHYSKIFKKACPTAYSYAYDDPTSIFTCSGSDYVISFCSYRKKPVGT
ncbi:hypothetical protein HID58_073494 [Brassica napus]|uniref:Thaumatin-like protein n=1 Tax=Brassica napus TaxID=3708 RepID=A0ABQ7Z7D4_BRANA|nr:hypothetical protein HID58_073494 [Brassica napus]